MMNKYKTLIYNILIFAFGNLIVKVISFVLMPIYTAMLTTEEYGISELLNSMVEIVLPIVTLCIIEALYRFSIDDEENHKSLFTNSLFVVAIGSLLVGIFCSALKILIHVNYSLLFWMLYTTCVFYKMTIQFARGLGHAKRYSFYGIFNSIILVSGNIIFLCYLHMGITGYILSFIIGYGLTSILAFICSKEFKYLSIKSFNYRTLKEMIKYSFPNIPNMLSWWFNSVSDRYIIILFCGINIAGIYTAASKLPALVNIVASIFQLAWQYSTVKEIKKDDSKTFFNTVFKWYSYICINSCIFLILTNNIFCSILLKEKFYGARNFVPLLLIAALFGCFSTYLGTFYNAQKNNKMLMKSTVLGAIINVVLNFILIPKYSAYGAAYATLISYLFIAVYRYVDIKKSLGINIEKKYFIIRMICLVLCYICSIFDNSILGIIMILISLSVGEEIQKIILFINRKIKKLII